MQSINIHTHTQVNHKNYVNGNALVQLLKVMLFDGKYGIKTQNSIHMYVNLFFVCRTNDISFENYMRANLWMLFPRPILGTFVCICLCSSCNVVLHKFQV